MEMEQASQGATNVESNEDGSPEEEQETEHPAVFLDKDIPAQREQVENEQKMQNFLETPEKSIRIFLSSYARSMGFIWCVASLSEY